MIGERKHGDSVAADERRANRSFDEYGRFPSWEHGRIAALRKVDDQFIRAAFLTVVVDQLGALADFNIIEGNPLADIGATKNVRMVIKGGEVMKTIYDPKWVNPIPRGTGAVAQGR